MAQSVSSFCKHLIFLMHVSGFIRDVRYNAHFTEPLTPYELRSFDINTASPYGSLQTADAQIGFSKWVSPKRTRTYPFARIYNTYKASKILTVIPVIKDEGRDGDLDAIQFSTISWMSLLNIHIVLAYYSSAVKNNTPRQRHRHKLTQQCFDKAYVLEQIREIFAYKASALHWNRSLFESRFVYTYETALAAYRRISVATGVEIHNQANAAKYLEKIKLQYDYFKDASLRASQRASHRESLTTHAYEYLEEGSKATLNIQNYLGGVYHLTADRLFKEDGRFIIEESKHTIRGSLPSVEDIKDGLFKLILYSNLDKLNVEDVGVPFTARLKLTGMRLIGSIKLPADEEKVDLFITQNRFVLTARQREIVRLLQKEASGNDNLEVLIKGTT